MKVTSSAIDFLISKWLLLGVLIATLFTSIGGILYLYQHIGTPLPDYTHFSYTQHPSNFESYTTFRGIFNSFLHFESKGWIQMGVVILFSTPIIRLFIALIGYILLHDRLYSCITCIVITIIFLNYLL